MKNADVISQKMPFVLNVFVKYIYNIYNIIWLSLNTYIHTRELNRFLKDYNIYFILYDIKCLYFIFLFIYFRSYIISSNFEFKLTWQFLLLSLLPE